MKWGIIMYEIDDERFWENYAKNDYLDIFYIRTKVWRGLVKARPPINARSQAMIQVNRFPANKNMLYFHVPFCASRCSYCLYYTKIYDKASVDEYLRAIAKEVESISDTEYIQSTRFECVYFGGGTPSMLAEEQIDWIAALLFQKFHFTDDLEISFEVNPASITEAKMKALKRNNFNRISLGIQSFNDKYLKEMNCKHNAAEAREVVRKFLDEGFIVNVDLIYGFSGQTKEELKNDLEEILKLKGVHHISAFPLRLVTQTPLYHELEKRQELDLRLHQHRLANYLALISQFLKSQGYICEEESVHYYREGFRPHRYQSLDGRIIGFGAGAGTLIDNVESGNIFDVKEYIDNVTSGNGSAFADSVITDEQTYERFILYRLLYMNRSLPDLKGLIGKRFREFYGIDIGGRYEKVIGYLLRKRWIEMNGEQVIFTSQFNNILKNFRFGTPSII